MWRISENIGWIISLIISFIPVVLWVNISPVIPRVSTTNGILTSVGQLTGLVGMAMFAVSMMFSTRIHVVGWLFGGMHRAYQAHHLLGIWSTLLILLHPLALASVYAFFSFRSAAQFLLPSAADLPRTAGIVSLILLMVLMLITLYARFRYQLIKLFHQYLGVAFLFAGLHTFFIKSNVSQDFSMRTYMLALVVLGLISYAYRTVFGRFTVKLYDYRVRAVVKAEGNMVELHMTPLGRPLVYLPGQFVFVSLEGEGLSSEKHPFSLSSTPHEGELRILVKALGDYTKWVVEGLPVGTLAEVEGAYGSFIYFRTFSRTNKNQIWVAGGSGLAPFLGMARNLKESVYDIARSNPEEYEGYSVDLYYSARTKAELAFTSELADISLSIPGFRFIPFCADTDGFLTAEKIAAGSGGLQGKDFFVCGPPPMMKSLKKQFDEAGVPRHRVHMEEFRLL